MKKLIFKIIFITAIFNSGFSQSTTKIEKIFNKENYFEVIEILKEKEIFDFINLNEAELLALSYYYNNDYIAANPYFERIIKNKEFSNKNKFFYSHTLKAASLNDSLANNLLKDYYKDNAIDYNQYFEDITVLNKLGRRFTIENQKSINTIYSDIFSLEFNKKIYFSSTRPNELVPKKYKWNNQPYLDNYIYDQSNSNVISFNDINTDFHDSDVVINEFNSVVYFTSSKPDPNIFLRKDQVITTKIYQANFNTNGSLINIKYLPFNSNDYSCKSPFVDLETKRLYFTSNKPGGIGGFDIYYTDLNNFDNVVNLGSEVNSINDEDNFFIDSNKNIYFASNGYVGYGGKDIFTKIYNQETNTYKRVMNVGLPVNSSSDDFGYKNKGNIGYFTSNRAGGIGDDDIYSFVVIKPLELDKIIQRLDGVVYDSKTNAKIPKATIILKDEFEEFESKEVKSDFLGNYTFEEITGEKEYSIIIKAPLYKDTIVTLKTNSIKYNEIVKDLYLELAPCTQNFYGIIKDNKTNLSLKNALVKFQDAKSKYFATTRTNELGEYSINVPCDKLLIIKISLEQSDDPYYAEYNEFIETDKEYSKKHLKDVNLIPVDSRGLISDKNGNVKIPTKPIYFDYNSAVIDNVSFEDLDKVATLMKEHLNWKLIIESHSDIRGSDTYNLSLSKKRAAATKNYLVSSGIDQARISTNGYGESKPIIICVDRECSEEEHAINRRSEFIIK